jgi:hypothetical protein
VPRITASPELLITAVAPARDSGGTTAAQKQQAGTGLITPSSVSSARQNGLFCTTRTGLPEPPPARQNGCYLKSPAKSVSGQVLCGGDMSLPNGTCETRNTKSGSEKGTDAGHVGDITSGAAETPL